jgi:hypothetical protein
VVVEGIVTSGAEATIVAPPHAVAVEVAPLLVAPLRAARRLRATARPRVARLPAAVAPCRLRRLVEVEVEAEVGAATAGTRATKAGTYTAAARRRAAPRRRDAGEVSPPPALPLRFPVDFGDRIQGGEGARLGKDTGSLYKLTLPPAPSRGWSYRRDGGGYANNNTSTHTNSAPTYRSRSPRRHRFTSSRSPVYRRSQPRDGAPSHTVSPSLCPPHRVSSYPARPVYLAAHRGLSPP